MFKLPASLVWFAKTGNIWQTVQFIWYNHRFTSNCIVMHYIHRIRHSYPLFTQLILCLALLGGLGACTEDEEIMAEAVPEEPVGYPEVDESLWVYFERFEAEGRRRGVTVDLRLARVSGQLQEIDKDRVLGQCNYQRNNHNRVTVDESFWNSIGDRGREFVVFHELGHCFLLREHLETVSLNGACTSIMRSGTGRCRDNYNRLTRETYLAELFDTQLAGDILQR